MTPEEQLANAFVQATTGCKLDDVTTEVRVKLVAAAAALAHWFTFDRIPLEGELVEA